MGWHADDEPEMGNVIGSPSLGATRKFRISTTSPEQLRHSSQATERLSLWVERCSSIGNMKSLKRT